MLSQQTNKFSELMAFSSIYGKLLQMEVCKQQVFADSTLVIMGGSNRL
jgi:ribonuclease HI